MQTFEILLIYFCFLIFNVHKERSLIQQQQQQQQQQQEHRH